MLSRKNLLSVSMAGALALGVWAVASAQGELPDQRTFFTFSAPVTLPGTTLQAGKYEFKLMNSNDRHIVQVFDADGKIVTTLFAIPSIRMDPPDKPEIRFMETPADLPPAVQTWWYPGNRTGHEFLYSKDQATILAKMNQRGVLAGGEKGDVMRVNAAGEETRVSSTEAKAEEVSGRAQAGEVAARAAAAPIPDSPPPPIPDTPQPAPVTQPAPVRTPVAQPAPVAQPEIPRDVAAAPRASAVDTDRTSLPNSASPLPMFLLIGVGSMGAGLVLRRKLA